MGNRGFEKVTFSAPCVDLTFEGFGVTRNGKDVVFVPGMFPGDEGDVQIEYRRAGQLYGKLVRLLGAPCARFAVDACFKNTRMKPSSDTRRTR